MTTYRVWGPNDLYAWNIRDRYYAERMVEILQEECADIFSCDGCKGSDPCYHIQEIEDDSPEGVIDNYNGEARYGIWGNYETLAEWAEQYGKA